MADLGGKAEVQAAVLDLREVESETSKKTDICLCCQLPFSSSDLTGESLGRACTSTGYTRTC